MLLVRTISTLISGILILILIFSILPRDCTSTEQTLKKETLSKDKQNKPDYSGLTKEEIKFTALYKSMKAKSASVMAYQYYVPAEDDVINIHKNKNSKGILKGIEINPQKNFNPQKSNENDFDTSFSVELLDKNDLTSSILLERFNQSLEKLIEYSSSEKKKELIELKSKIRKNLFIFFNLKAKTAEKQFLNLITNLIDNIERNLLKALDENDGVMIFKPVQFEYISILLCTKESLEIIKDLEKDVSKFAHLSSTDRKVDPTEIKEEINKIFHELYDTFLERLETEPLENNTTNVVKLINEALLRKGWKEFEINFFWHRFVQLGKFNNLIFYWIDENESAKVKNIYTSPQERAREIKYYVKKFLSHVNDNCYGVKNLKKDDCGCKKANFEDKDNHSEGSKSIDPVISKQPTKDNSCTKDNYLDYDCNISEEIPKEENQV